MNELNTSTSNPAIRFLNLGDNSDGGNAVTKEAANNLIRLILYPGLKWEDYYTSEIFGLAGGVSYMFEDNEGKRFIKKISDLSYIN